MLACDYLGGGGWDEENDRRGSVGGAVAMWLDDEMMSGNAAYEWPWKATRCSV